MLLLFPPKSYSFFPSLTHSFPLFLYLLLPLFTFFPLFFFLHNLEPSIQICSNMSSRPPIFLLTSKRMPLPYYFVSCSTSLCQCKGVPLVFILCLEFLLSKICAELIPPGFWPKKKQNPKTVTFTFLPKLLYLVLPLSWSRFPENVSSYIWFFE